VANLVAARRACPGHSGERHFMVEGNGSARPERPAARQRRLVNGPIVETVVVRPPRRPESKQIRRSTNVRRRDVRMHRASRRWRSERPVGTGLARLERGVRRTCRRQRVEPALRRRTSRGRQLAP
jgi:hypothetical protein